MFGTPVAIKFLTSTSYSRIDGIYRVGSGDVEESLLPTIAWFLPLEFFSCFVCLGYVDAKTAYDGLHLISEHQIDANLGPLNEKLEFP
ncbi:hypothetical protein RHMOL_Rhmol06G0014300 [Rhododendron molle]|uniref:Uncharacterized protein n=1 Tax=Rhododendron molle TaxID=49168 RepID=A0ACC0N8S3_RHOML|nr:hypothetical protein RHMOL_Rhmol06G0014300 [Rhododendron molle]